METLVFARTIARAGAIRRQILAVPAERAAQA